VKLTLLLLPQTLSICRLNPTDPLPNWVMRDPFFALTRTADELSVICSQGSVPPSVINEPDWRAFKVAGPLGFSLTGVLAGLAGALAKAEISLFAVSTFDTDYILVKSHTLQSAIAALRSAGHLVKE
jgi:hypothetical protein